MFTNDKMLLLVIFLCLLLFALMLTPRPQENYRKFSEAHETYREMQEVAAWSH